MLCVYVCLSPSRLFSSAEQEEREESAREQEEPQNGTVNLLVDTHGEEKLTESIEHFSFTCSMRTGRVFDINQIPLSLSRILLLLLLL